MEVVTATQCKVPRCDQIAEIIVRDQEFVETEVCRGHWRDMLRASDGAIRGIHLLHRPRCCEPACKDFAVAFVTDPDGSQHPTCQHHWDDLSLADVPQGLLSDTPGWSHV